MLLPKEIIHLILQKSSKKTIKNFALTSHYWYFMCKKYLKYDYTLYSIGYHSIEGFPDGCFHKVDTYYNVSSLQELGDKIVDQYDWDMLSHPMGLFNQFFWYHIRYIFDNSNLLPKLLYDNIYHNTNQISYQEFCTRWYVLMSVNVNTKTIPVDIIKSLFSTLFKPVDLINYISNYQNSKETNGLHFLVRSDDPHINIFENFGKN